MVESSVKELAKGPNFGAFTTLFPGEKPSTHIMWVDADDEHLLINTEIHRAKYKNVKRDPRVALAIWNKDNPYAYAEVRGEVVGEVRGDEARKHIDDLSMKYNGSPYANRIQSERVILKIRPDRQRG